MNTTEESRGRRKERVGVVVSNAMQKTIVVRVERRFPHPLYRKVRRRATQYHVHDEANEAQVGDRVRITETRPLSRRKHWRLTAILGRASAPGTGDDHDRNADQS